MYNTTHIDEIEPADPWSSAERALRPSVYSAQKQLNMRQAGATGDLSLPVTTTTLWADPSNHATTYGTSANGFWRFGINLFPQFLFPATGTFLIGFSGTIQSGTVQMDVELLDAASNILTSASMLVTYVVNCTNFAAFDYALTVNSQTQGSESIAQWNAVRVRCTCSNTNLSSLLSYGPLGSSSSPSAGIFYLLSDVVAGNVVGIG